MTPSHHHSLPGHELYDRLREALRLASYDELDSILIELKTVCCTAAEESGKKECDKKRSIEKDELKFWLIDVGRLMFEEKAKTRELALDAFESAVAHIRATDYQDHSSWSELREIVSKEYTSLLDIARSEKDPNWHRVWSVLVRIMNRDLCQGSTIINMFLSIVEAGFRSPELSIREQSFDCWRLLVEIFANNKQINIPKRVKLICIPLKSSKSKTETIALKKFDIWWYLLCQLRSQLDTMAETIFEPFIYFCFGPSFKTPLCYYFDESYKELGAPGKMYQSIKQLSGIALIHLLGPATDICKTLLTCPDNSGSTLSFEFPQTEMAISDMLFSTKAKLIIDSCIECTVLLSEMQHLDYRAVNRCVWNNLIRRIQNEKTIPKNDMLQWIKEDMNALLKLCLNSKHDTALRDLLYDTLLIIAESDLLHVKIGYDSPEQLMFNYQMIMPFVLNSHLPFPDSKSEEITNCLFDLKRYSAQNAYWDMLQKTIQYISHQDKNSTNNSIQFRTIRTRIYILLGNHLADQMSADSEGFLAHQTTVMSFLLYPLEYDQLLLVENVKELWTKLYDEVVKHDSKCCELKNTFCEMIKAMTVAKHGYNLAVLADFFCYIIQSLPAHFEATSPPVKVLELFKDVSRKGLAYKSNLDRVEVMVRCFRELLEKLDARDILILVLPIRNAINELVSNENGLAMNEVKKTLKVVSNKMLLKEMTTDLISQSNDVKWNYKMLLKTLLDLPEDLKKGWKTAEMKKRMIACEGNISNTKTPTRKTPDDEFVVIEKVWKFQPEMLTEHQREKMMEKRTDIPALYNDMSQSQDSFVIKPWTPSKGVASLKQERTKATAAVTTVDNAPPNPVESSIAAKEIIETLSTVESDPLISTTTDSACDSNTHRLDKENNNGNVLRDQSVTSLEKEGQTESEEDKAAEKQQNRRKSILDQLRIDTVEGKNLNVMNLSRTRHSESLETRTTRRKSMSSQKMGNEKKRNNGEIINQDTKSASASKAVKSKGTQQRERRMSRKLLKFDNDEQATNSMPSSSSQHQSKADVSDDVIESSQSDSSETTNRRTSFAKPKAQEPKEKTIALPAPSTEMKQTEEITMQNETPHLSPIKEMNASDTSTGTKVNDVQNNDSDNSVLPNQKKETGVTVPAETKESPNKGIASDDSTTKPETHQQSSSTSSACEHQNAVVTSPTVMLSPNRRSSRLSLEDNKQNIGKLVAFSPKKLLENKNVATLLYSPSRSIHKQEIMCKGTPSKNTNDACNNAMREALQIGSSSNSTTNDKDECKLVENRSGLSSPKVARFSPLVVLEPIVNLGKPLQDVDGSEPKDISHPISSAMVTQNDEKLSSCNAQQSQPSEEHRASHLTPATHVDTNADCTPKMCPEQPMISVEQSTREQSELGMEQLSPIKNLDEEMEPLNKSLNRSIVSSPDLAGVEDRNADLLNSTLNISPISEEKGTMTKCVDSGELAGSADRRSSGRIVGREREIIPTSNTPVQTPLMSRRTKPDPTPQTPSGSGSGLKARRQPSITRSPRTSMIGMGGRGAQLINLIRNQQTDQSPKPNTPPQNASTPKGGQSSATANRLMMRKRAIVGSAASSAPVDDSTALETLKEREEMSHNNPSQYLVFSKVLPSPQASPAGSILKRRHNQDESGDDIDSPVNKRKRVSFHDPPVSLTKEYIRQVEECRPASVSRSLQLNSNIMSSADRAKFLMRRKSKSDSISELQNFTNEQTNAAKKMDAAISENAPNDENMEGEEEELTSSPESLDEHEFMMHDGTNNMTALQVSSDCMDVDGNENKSNSKSKIDDVKEQKTLDPLNKQQGFSEILEKSNETQSKHIFPSEDAVLEHVMNRYSLDDMFERYIAAGKTLEKTKTIRSLTKELSSKMSDDSKTRDIVLDELSERHSVEFLDHAIQENSNAKVCERLSTLAMMDHVFKQLHTAYNAPSGDKTPAVPQNEKEETIRLIENIYENLLSLPIIETDSPKLIDLREQLLKQGLARKSRLEIMALLEHYFKSSSSE
uniref:Telomere-associated protein Rif1 N-terminal domain-containing protein n=1 Tax=Anopheles quadriannulatus TaxID=34691 RepID=A0A182XFN3_ANOQN